MKETPVRLRAVIDGSDFRAGDAVHVWPSDPGAIYVVHVSRVTTRSVIAQLRAGILRDETPNANARVILRALAALTPLPELDDPDRK